MKKTTLLIVALLVAALSTATEACDDCPEHPKVARGYGCDGFYHEGPEYVPPGPVIIIPTIMILGHIIYPQSGWGGLWDRGLSGRNR